MRSPTLPDLQYEIGARIGRGDFAGAAVAAGGCRARWPHDAAGWLLGSIVALLQDDKNGALRLIEERLVTDPANVQCLLQKAECLLALGDRTASLAAANTAAANADERASLDAVGEFLYHAEEYRRALDVYDRAVAAAPRDPFIRAKRSDVHRVLGNLERAANDFETVLAIEPRSPRALKGLAELRRASHDRDVIAPMEAALAAAAAGSTDAAILHFALAESYGERGDPTRSWQHLTAGNRIERARIDYTPEADLTFIDRIIEAFPVAESPTPDRTGVRPIFIVGIPRTGTTLVERIIGGHSQVHSTGEITAMTEAINSALEQRRAATLGDLDGTIIADEYLARTRALGCDRPRFTDKLLTNFFHCALIFRAFPKASIVHVTRHPLAACHAIYRTRFNGTYPFSYDLADIAAFYLGYRRLMSHWHAVLPGRILDVAYEEVVTALEPTTRRMLDYAGLPFEPGCLEFQRNPAPVKTTSSVQVRQPLYDSSLELWRHHAVELQPLRERLEAAGIRIE